MFLANCLGWRVGGIWNQELAYPAAAVRRHARSNLAKQPRSSRGFLCAPGRAHLRGAPLRLGHVHVRKRVLRCWRVNGWRDKLRVESPDD